MRYVIYRIFFENNKKGQVAPNCLQLLLEQTLSISQMNRVRDYLYLRLTRGNSVLAFSIIFIRAMKQNEKKKWNIEINSCRKYIKKSRGYLHESWFIFIDNYQGIIIWILSSWEKWILMMQLLVWDKPTNAM